MARLFPQSASLQNLPGEFRGAIGSNYHDLDMKNNRRLSILLQYCQMTQIHYKELKYYVKNRDVIVKKITNDYQFEKEMLSNYFKCYEWW